MATKKTGKEVEEEEDDKDPYEDWTPDQPIPDEDGEEAARKRVILERRTEYLKEQAGKKRKKKTGNSGSGWF